MEQAPNVLVLLNFIHNLEQSARSLVLATGIPQCHTPRSKAERLNSTTQVKVMILGGVEIGLTPGGKEEYLVYDAALSFDVETDTQEDKNLDETEIGSRHSEWVSKIKELMLSSNTGAWNTTGGLKYYKIIRIEPKVEVTDKVAGDEDVDVTHLEYVLRFQIVRKAWPAGY